MGIRGGRGVPPVEIFLLTPPRKRQKFGNKTEEFIDPPANFQGPYVVNLILYVVTENFYDPPMSFDPKIPMVYFTSFIHSLRLSDVEGAVGYEGDDRRGQ